MKYVIIGLLVALVISGGIVVWQTNRLEVALENVATEKANVSRLKDEIIKVNEAVTRLEIQRVQDQASIDTLSNQANAAETEKNRAIGKLTQIQRRLSDAIDKRPGLVGRIASSASRRVFRDVFKASGGKEPSSGSSPVSSAPTGTNSADKPENRGSDTKRNSEAE